MKKFNVAVVGASGMVGGELLGLLESRRFPVGEFYPFNSGRKPASVLFRGKKYACAAPSLEALKKAEIAFFVSTDEVAEEFAPRLAAAGTWCIDDSAFFRLAPGVPLVIPEVNAAELGPSKKLIAGPNCTLTGAAVALAGIHRKFGITELRLATYQAVSGAGKAAMGELEEELKAYFRKGAVPKLKGGKFPRPIAFNLFPQVGGFDEEGNSGEENKVEAELKKIWSDKKIRISVTAVRVPVLRGHSLAVWFKVARPCSEGALRKELRRTTGLKFFEKPGDYPTPLENGQRTEIVYAGRLRRARTAANEFQLWIVSDNLYKGAALNSVQIAERIARL
ncbi:MAG: aspartate-semialdehyde dehydrogenase [Elusimicrobiales bacterium]|nr:aspartate-semialdehyde dehydrogenase [Elusimicrobiales bacterium]